MYCSRATEETNTAVVDLFFVAFFCAGSENTHRIEVEGGHIKESRRLRLPYVTVIRNVQPAKQTASQANQLVHRWIFNKVVCSGPAAPLRKSTVLQVEINPRKGGPVGPEGGVQGPCEFQTLADEPEGSARRGPQSRSVTLLTEFKS